MKLDLQRTVILLTIFTLGIAGSILFTSSTLNYYNLVSSYGVQTYSISPFYELLYLLIGLLVITGIILLLIHFKLIEVVIGLFIFVSFLVLLDFFNVLFSPLFSVFGEQLTLASLALSILFIVYYFKYAGSVGMNVINIIMFITISSIVSLALNILTAMILIAVIAIYDYIAVFVTKHMITLAKGLKNRYLLGGITLAAHRTTKRGTAFLGGGDMVFPMIFVDAVFQQYSVYGALFAAAGAILGLSLILIYGKRGKAYPAMAFMGPLQLLFFAGFILLHFI
jgi:presenilin-like A22 family membrane protease